MYNTKTYKKTNPYYHIMVIICPYIYPDESKIIYQSYYEQYPYELHNFQKWSIESVVTGNDLLVCCPTGSGKTFSGEFAISYFNSKRKKIIYTTPIKALSNEKFHNFAIKYPNITFGLITGDIKTNPDADVLIMTTEILLNKLYQIRSENCQQHNSSISFDMDIQNELGCVVFDEIHMINDEHRGGVWEQCIMMMPYHVQIIGLSATLHKPEAFATWMENTRKPVTSSAGNDCVKQTYLTRKLTRTVPLIHYNFVTTNSTIFKTIKDKQVRDEINKYINKPHIIQDASGHFDEIEFNRMKKMLALFDKHKVFVKRQHTLNKVCEHLVQNKMLPALCYVFSRKQLEKCAHEITTNLLEFDSKVPYTIDRECEHIVRKLSNFEEYINLPEYITVVKLLRKGIGIHHAGLMPILREMTEILFAKGVIKVLFCTETMSVGINLPVKTTIFTDIKKFNGEHLRLLQGHEYTQAAGRAGRLGLDKVGHVIHLNNLFRDITQLNYKKMLKGEPPNLTSKFKMSYNLFLGLIDSGNTNFVEFIEKSMVNLEINKSIKSIETSISEIDVKINSKQETISYLKTPQNVMENFRQLTLDRTSSINKKRKQIDKDIRNTKNEFPNIERDIETYNGLLILNNNREQLNRDYNNTTSFLLRGVNNILEFMRRNGFFVMDETTGCPILTNKGKIANCLKEVHCVVFAGLIEDNRLTNMTARELVALFSCFTNISISDDYKIMAPERLIPIIAHIVDNFTLLQEEECQYSFKTGTSYNIHYDLMTYVEEWFDAENVEECKAVLHKIECEKEVFLGDFVKALLKINNIVLEMETVAELIGNVPFLHELNKIRCGTLKYVVTNQSLYV